MNTYTRVDEMNFKNIHKRRCLRFSAGLVTAHTNQHQIHRLETNLFIIYSFDVDSCQLWSIDVKDEDNWGNKGTTISLAFIWIGKNAIWSDSVGRSKAARTTTYKELKKRSTRSLFLSDFEFVKLCVLACVCCGCARAHATSFPCGNKIRLEEKRKKEKEKRKKERKMPFSLLFEWWNRWINKFTWRGNGSSLPVP